MPAESPDAISEDAGVAVRGLRVLVCGGRDYSDFWMLRATLNRLLAETQGFHLIHGGARGADLMAGEWAAEAGLSSTPFPADWRKDGKAAGPTRNARMLAEGKPDLVIAFPGGRGTKNMVDQAEAAGVPVRRVDHE